VVSTLCPHPLVPLPASFPPSPPTWAPGRGWNWCVVNRDSPTGLPSSLPPIVVNTAGVKVTLQIWDIGGQSIGNKMIKKYVAGAQVGVASSRCPGEGNLFVLLFVLLFPSHSHTPPAVYPSSPFPAALPSGDLTPVCCTSQNYNCGTQKLICHPYSYPSLSPPPPLPPRSHARTRALLFSSSPGGAPVLRRHKLPELPGSRGLVPPCEANI
jgi:hypothetical protein